jgi:predicted DNA-binding transcriptional regulator AlpA
MEFSQSDLVRKKEFARKLNVGTTKFWELQKAGVIPPPVHLPMLCGKPGRVCYWPSAVVAEVLRKVACQANVPGPFLNDPFGRAAAEEVA